MGVDLKLPRPIFLTVGRLAVEKNLEAFLALDLPGTKVVVGDGPSRASLERKFPDAIFVGARRGEALATIYSAADVFVFPSRPTRSVSCCWKLWPAACRWLRFRRRLRAT